MTRFESVLLDIGLMDTLACRDSLVHRLDPRAKLLTTLIFVITVVSFDKYEISALFPFFIFPIILITLGNLPLNYLIKKLILVSPFVLFIGIFNPILDREIFTQLGPLEIAGGWVSFVSIVLRFILTVISALILISSTGFISVCMAVEKLGAPRIFAIQLLFLYRYLFVLIEEASRIVRARALRSFGGKGMGIRVFCSLIGHMLIRTFDRSHRIHQAMLCRGFDGEIRIRRPLKIRYFDVLFTLGFSILFVLMRFYNVPQILGNFIMERLL
jgi:cobalt/nickel transport system permease protein